MPTYHVHINGLVQGVGFRPFVAQLAVRMHLTGIVHNSNDGVHIEFNAEEEAAQTFYQKLLLSPPLNAILKEAKLNKIPDRFFYGFSIVPSTRCNKPTLLLTTDIALCPECKEEINDPENRRYGYPFITCLHCGPRYSIIAALPYDRESTTMDYLHMCSRCSNEYNDIYNRRHYSQTNSCVDCAIQMHLYENKNNCICSDTPGILLHIQDFLQQGKILAVKGIGGYLLICDATSEKSITELRKRKQRPSKPFAVLYPKLEILENDVCLNAEEKSALQDNISPIVLCFLRKDAASGICKETIAPGLDKLGVMLPYTGLLQLIANNYGKPLIATSGNISGSPILYKDKDALDSLFPIADFVITFDRDIVVPQDDSVVQFTTTGQRIIIRRSRGLAPNYHPNPFLNENRCLLAMGAELKSAFAITSSGNLYISQFLGDQAGLTSQHEYEHTLSHVQQILQATPEYILADKHPGYFVSDYGRVFSRENKIPLLEIQHHKAHFAAVLAENNLLQAPEPVLGIVWDGTGYGDDGQIWGGEFFVSANNSIERIAHMSYFPQLLGDKMSREPRLSALSLLSQIPEKYYHIRKDFSPVEWNYYQQLLLQPAILRKSSMGRLLDGIASLLGLQQQNQYEGEAAMKLEALARKAPKTIAGTYSINIQNGKICISEILSGIIRDIENGIMHSVIAVKIFNTLAGIILQVSLQKNINKIAFSGGVFQNTFLVDTIKEQMPPEKELYFHKQVSPNDECISLGQIAYFVLTEKNK